MEHHGNVNSSPEEAERVAELVTLALAPGAHWVDRKGNSHDLTLDDILIVAPYNLQVQQMTVTRPATAHGRPHAAVQEVPPQAVCTQLLAAHEAVIAPMRG